MPQIIAIFDLEGTLCLGSRLIWRAIVKLGLRQPGGIFRVVIHILSLILLNNLYRLRLISGFTRRRKALAGMASLLKGMSIVELDELADQITCRIMETMRSDTVQILIGHNKQNHIVLLCSGLFTPILEVLGRQLGALLAIGTDLEVKDGRYTGRIESNICLHDRRVDIIRRYLQNKHVEPDLAHSYAYGNSKWDIPVLEMVGHPVAVYPDNELRDLAWNRGWKIIC